VFIGSALVVEFGAQAWGDVSKCGAECMFSGIQILKSASAARIAKGAIFTAVLAGALYAPLMLLTWLVTSGVQRFTSFSSRANFLTAASSMPAYAGERQWHISRVYLFRDVVFILLYLSITAFLVFWPSSRLSYNLNGTDFIVSGVLTESGVRYYMYLFSLRCLQVVIFFAALRIVDAIPRDPNQESQ
jgi:hypothetical protein